MRHRLLYFNTLRNQFTDGYVKVSYISREGRFNASP